MTKDFRYVRFHANLIPHSTNVNEPQSGVCELSGKR